MFKIQRALSCLLSAAVAAASFPLPGLARMQVRAAVEAPAPCIGAAPLNLGSSRIDSALPENPAILPIATFAAKIEASDARARFPERQAELGPRQPVVLPLPRLAPLAEEGQAVPASPERSRLAGLFRNPSLDKVRGQDQQRQQEGLEELY